MTATSTLRRLPIPEPGRIAAEAFIVDHLSGLYFEEEVHVSPRFRGGQQAADRALQRFDVTGYGRRRNEAFPESRRGASRLSPYIRHGLLTLPMVWNHVEGGPEDDVTKFRNEMLWQEYARHWYARLGRDTGSETRRRYPTHVDHIDDVSSSWDRNMACLELTLDELEDDGWLVNQTRMWLASHWSVRNRHDWRHGEEYFFRHLLDGSRAANRLGWQWATGVGSNKAYGFSRWQVEKRAPGLCSTCEVAAECPIIEWPAEVELEPVERSPLIRRDPDPERTAGPKAIERVRRADDGPSGDSSADPVAVWLTAESLGASDPALTHHPEASAVFVFDAPLLGRLQLSSKRLAFLVETLSELATLRPVELWLGSVTDRDAVSGTGERFAHRPMATTFAPVPGWRRRAASLPIVEVHPWPWLRRPGDGNIGSFSTWLRDLH